MKQYIHTTSTYLLLLLLTGTCFFSSCSDEEAVGPGKKADDLSLSIVANVSTSIQTRATDNPATDTRNRNGSWIKDLTIFLFTTDATDTSKPLLTKTIQVANNPAQLNQANEVELTSQELRNAGIGVGSHVTIYAIANHIPSDAANLTKKQVIEQRGTLPDYTTENSWGKQVVPMTDRIDDYTISSNNHQTISLAMRRAVMRIAVNIIDAEFDNNKYTSGRYSWCITSVKLYNDYAATYLWNEGIPSNPGCRAEDKAIGTTTTSYPTANNVPAGTFYLNCNEGSTAHPAPEPIKIKISGSRTNDKNIETPFEYTIDLKKVDNTHLFERNTSLTATLTLNAGSVDIKTEAIPWDQEVNANEGETLMQPEPKANSYIVKPKSAILIPVSHVQDVVTFNGVFAPEIADGESLTAELIWTDVKSASSGKGLAEDASIAEIKVLGKGPDALLLIVTGTQTGNSVVSVQQETGTFVWSWYIWVTEYDPETTNYISGSYTFMDRNLGARTNEPDPDGQNSNGVIGTYYQWGRPTPLPSKSFTSTSAPATIYDAEGNIVSRTPTTDYRLMGNPKIFYIQNYSNGYDYWKIDTKSIFDPCPPGWRVPSRDAWSNVTFQTLQKSGMQTDAGFYPASQAYMEINEIKGYSKPFFWSTNLTATKGQAYSYNYINEASTSGTFSNLMDYFAVPVRCIKE